MTEDDIQPCPYCGAPAERFALGGKWHYTCDCQEPVEGVTNAMMHQEKLRLCKAVDERNAAYRALVYYAGVAEMRPWFPSFPDIAAALKAARAFVESEKEAEE